MTDSNYNILITGGAIIALVAIIVGLILLYKIGQVRDKTKLTIFAIVCFFFYYMAIINPFVLRICTSVIQLKYKYYKKSTGDIQMYNIHLKLKGLDRNNVAFILSILNANKIKKEYTPEHDSTLWKDYVFHYEPHDGLIRKNGYYEILTKIITIVIEQLLNGTVSGTAPSDKEWELYINFKSIPPIDTLCVLLRALAFFVIDYDIPIIPARTQHEDITGVMRFSYTLTATVPQLVAENILPYARLIQILKTYIDNDAEYCETSVVYDKLADICGCSLDEIKALGYEYTIPEIKN